MLLALIAVNTNRQRLVHDCQATSPSAVWQLCMMLLSAVCLHTMHRWSDMTAKLGDAAQPTDCVSHRHLCLQCQVELVFIL